MDAQQLQVSMCTYQDGKFELFLIDPHSHEEIAIAGERRFSEKEMQFFERLMPACVWTTYQREAA